MDEDTKKQISDEIDSFIAGPKKNEWLYPGPIRLYIRKSWRILNGNRHPTIDIATVEIETDERHKGIFTWMCEHIVKVSPHTVYIENVQYAWLCSSLTSRGWKRDTKYPFDFCFYKEKLDVSKQGL